MTSLVKLSTPPSTKTGDLIPSCHIEEAHDASK